MTAPVTPKLYGSYPAFVSVTTLLGKRWFMANHPDLPGCMSDGETEDMALENLTDARELYLESMREDGVPIPEPFSAFSLTAGTAGAKENHHLLIARGSATIENVSGSIQTVQAMDPVAVLA